MFFPSYRVMEMCYDQWQDHMIIEDIEKTKVVLKEPKNSSQYQLIIDRYYSNIFEQENGGAILMGVCRGRISEGLDFSDDAARCCIVVGIPYP